MISQASRGRGELHDHVIPTRLTALVLPIVIVILPTTILLVILVGLIFGYQDTKQPPHGDQRADTFNLVQQKPGLFPLSRPNLTTEHQYILVNFSATQLVFLASWPSTLALILAAPLMKIWSLQAAQSLQTSSITFQADLPTQAQLSSLVGLLEASTNPLVGCFKALVSGWFAKCAHTPKTSPPRPHSPPLASGSVKPSATPLMPQHPLRPLVPTILTKAATIATLCTVSAFAVFVADTWLDIFTEPVRFEAVSVNEPSLQFGRGINPKCLYFNRTANHGFPCSYAEINGYWTEMEIRTQRNEILFPQHNNSRQSENQFVQNENPSDEDHAILLPQTLNLPGKVDFRSSTIGVSTQCRPISSTCNMRASDADSFHTQYNCSVSFWGVLGRPPNISEINDSKTKAYDADLPGLDWKPSADLQYGYFADSELTTPYNTIGYDVESGDPDPSLPSMPDDQFINPVYVGIAGRFATDDAAVGSQLSNDTRVWHGPNQYIDFVLDYHYTTYDVKYTWVNGTIQNVSYVPTPNGSVSEIFHGMQVYDTISGGNGLLQDDLLQVALQNTSTALASEWAKLSSVWVLSTIGTYAVPQTTLQEQLRTELLVAQIPVAALAALVATGLIYVILAAVLGSMAYRSSRSRDTRYIAAQLHRDGLCAAAFGEDNAAARAKAGELTTVERGTSAGPRPWKAVTGHTSRRVIGVNGNGGDTDYDGGGGRTPFAVFTIPSEGRGDP